MQRTRARHFQEAVVSSYHYGGVLEVDIDVSGCL